MNCSMWELVLIDVRDNHQDDMAAAEEELKQAVAIATQVFELGSRGVYDPAFEAEMAYGAMAQDDLAFLLCQVRGRKGKGEMGGMSE